MGAEHECSTFEAGANGKTCVHYLTNGGCSLKSEFMCVVWLRKQREKGLAPPAPPRALPIAPPEVTQALQPSKKACGCAELPVGFRTSDLLEVKKRGLEITLQTKHLGEVHIVPALTGSEGRIELTYENLALLVGAKLVFPDAELTALRVKDPS